MDPLKTVTSLALAPVKMATGIVHHVGVVTIDTIESTSRSLGLSPKRSSVSMQPIASCPAGQKARGDGSCEQLAGAGQPCPESEADRPDGCIAPDGRGVWSRQAADYLDVTCPQGMAPGGDGRCYKALPDKGFFTLGRVLTWGVGAAMGAGLVLAFQDMQKRKKR